MQETHEEDGRMVPGVESYRPSEMHVGMVFRSGLFEPSGVRLLPSMTKLSVDQLEVLQQSFIDMVYVVPVNSVRAFLFACRHRRLNIAELNYAVELERDIVDFQGQIVVQKGTIYDATAMKTMLAARSLGTLEVRPTFKDDRTLGLECRLELYETAKKSAMKLITKMYYKSA
ncbi:hypothetical protein JYT83_01235 [bacterium AH-315-F18]|nr:hypothetical protein [bacterium AH-315-F18]